MSKAAKIRKNRFEEPDPRLIKAENDRLAILRDPKPYVESRQVDDVADEAVQVGQATDLLMEKTLPRKGKKRIGSV